VSVRRLGVEAALVDGRLLPGDVSVDGDVVAEVGLPPAPGGRVAAPGLVDLQVNGFAGVDVMDADEERVRALARSLPAYGVTAWLPTLITAPAEHVGRALDVLAAVVPPAGARAPLGEAVTLGVHLEGPYLSPRRLGTHPAAHRRDPDPAEMASWRARGPVVAVTLAPELPGALDLVRSLSADGVLVSAGHTDATAAQADAAFDAGARTVTHLFNAMSALNHREPGVPGAALAREDVTVQMIVDGYHLAPEVVRVAWAAARGRVVLVTDATAAAGKPDGRYVLAGVELFVTDGAVRNAEGALAGSALTLDAAVRNACEIGIDPAAALTAATEAPARLLRRTDVGSLRPGARADVTVFDDAMTLTRTLLAGQPVEGGAG
jgi:N-acetylglucosamine-6-phosphate deacetylase